MRTYDTWTNFSYHEKLEPCDISLKSVRHLVYTIRQRQLQLLSLRQVIKVAVCTAAGFNIIDYRCFITKTNRYW